MSFSRDISYNERGNRTEEYHYGSDGSLWRKRIYKYDAKGNILESLNYSYRGLQSKIQYDYDGRSNLTSAKMQYYNGSDNQSYIYKYTFDNKGNWISKTTYLNTIPKTLIEREITYFN